MATSEAPVELDDPGRTHSVTSLFSELDVVELVGDAEVSALVTDSRLATPGSMFLAMPGIHVDGHDYVMDAVRRGATSLVVERRMDVAVAQVVVPSVAAAAGLLAAAYHHHPSREMDLVGVTGTNGKTTTCQILKACLGVGGEPVGQVGTTGVFCGEDVLADANLSTPEALDIHEHFAEFRRRGVRRAAMEVTSHGLHQHRVEGVRFDVGVFLNLTPEHLDYHQSMDRYFEAKALLFDPSRCERAIVCIDDEWGRRLASTCAVPTVTFGTSSEADVRVVTTSHGLAGITVTLSGREEAEISSPLIGSVNGANVAAAYLAALALGVDRAEAARAIAFAEAPPGRFEIVSRDEPFLVVADYAHTPDALSRLIDAAREVTTGRVHVLFGARGGRYVEKRPMMTAAAMEADRIWLTSDSPGDEDPHAIIDHLVVGVTPGRDADVSIEIDRATAIRRAVATLEPGDTLLMTGRGPESHQRIGERVRALDDRVEARLGLDAQWSASTWAPRVGVVVVARDAENELAGTLGSIFRQTLAVHEVVVVDDGSTDATIDVAREFGRLVRVVHQPRLGHLAAANLGAASTRSPWIAFIRVGENWPIDRLASMLATSRATGVHASIAGREGDEGSTEWASLLVRRDVFGKLGGFNVSGDFWELWERIRNHSAT